MSEYKIMIVDDEPDILILLEKALNIEGFFNIAKIESGISAVDTCKKINPDIIILDVILCMAAAAFLGYGFWLKSSCHTAI